MKAKLLTLYFFLFLSSFTQSQTNKNKTTTENPNAEMFRMLQNPRLYKEKLLRILTRPTNNAKEFDLFIDNLKKLIGFNRTVIEAEHNETFTLMLSQGPYLFRTVPPRIKVPKFGMIGGYLYDQGKLLK
ncbi:hypothetical protein ACFFRR_000114 [Megaselia abdita]